MHLPTNREEYILLKLNTKTVLLLWHKVLGCEIWKRHLRAPTACSGVLSHCHGKGQHNLVMASIPKDHRCEVWLSHTLGLETQPGIRLWDAGFTEAIYSLQLMVFCPGGLI